MQTAKFAVSLSIAIFFGWTGPLDIYCTWVEELTHYSDEK